MNSTFALVGSLLFSIAILITASGLQGVLLPVRASIEHFTPLQVALLGSAYFAGYLLGCLRGPKLIQEVGHIRVFAGMTAIASVGSILFAISVTPEIWCFTRLLLGATQAIMLTVIESWLNDKASPENRGRIMSTYTAINLLSLTAGQLLLTVGDPKDFRLFGLASILISLAALPVIFTQTLQPTPVKSVKVRFKELYKISPVGVAGCFGVGLAMGAFWSLAPMFAEQNGLSGSDVAIFMTSAVIGGALSMWPMGIISDKMDRRYIIIGIAAFAMFNGLMLSLFGSNGVNWLYPLGFCFGLSAFPIKSICVAHTHDFAGKHNSVGISSSLLMVYSLGAVIGPLAASQLIELIDISALFLFTAIMHATLAAFAFVRMQRRASVPAEEKQQFRAMSQSDADLLHTEKEKDGA